MHQRPQKTLEDIASTVDQTLGQAKMDEADRKLLVSCRSYVEYMPEAGDTTAIAYLTDAVTKGYLSNGQTADDG